VTHRFPLKREKPAMTAGFLAMNKLQSCRAPAACPPPDAAGSRNASSSVSAMTAETPMAHSLIFVMQNQGAKPDALKRTEAGR